MTSSERTKWQKFKYMILGLIGAGFLAGVVVFVVLLVTLPDIDNPKDFVAAQSSVIMDRNGKVLYSIHGKENRKNVPLDKISKYAPIAAVSIEDDQFYEHMGIDIPALMKAVCSELNLCSQARGGSTITQQFARNAFLTADQTYSRKSKEILIALKLESKYTKDEIMEFYLNRIPYGSNIYGIEVASQTFFGKPAADLNIAESAILASIPKSTTTFFPYGTNVYAKINLEEAEILKQDFRTEQDLVDASTDYLSKGLLGKTYSFGQGDQKRDIYVKGRVAFVLERMELLGYITAEEREKAQKEADEMVFKPFRQDITAPHFVMYVKQILEEKYSAEEVEKGGFKVTTTLDLDLQKAAEEAIAKQAPKNEAYQVNNAGLISVDPDNGHIMAMVGSKDYWNDEIEGKNNMTLRPRQPGSSFKPIVYAAAFVKGYAPSTVLYDVKTSFGNYTPKNYDGTFKGPITIRGALGSSLNIPAVKAGYLAGIPNVLDLARKMGIALNNPDDWYGLPVSLGSGEARPLDMALAYSVFANGGYKVDPVAILKIEDKNGGILEEYQEPKNKKSILDPQVAFLVNDVLSDASARPGDFWKNALSIPGQVAAAKTGTSTKPPIKGVVYPQDNWTIGYVRNLTTAVWAGNTNGTHLRVDADGLNVAAPIWKNYMIKATQKVEKAPFDKPEGIKWVKVAKRSGKLPSKSTPPGDVVSAVFASFSVPTEFDNSYKIVEIDKVSGKLATEWTPEESREKKAFYIHHSILPDNKQWESAVQAWARASGQSAQPPTEYDDVHTKETMSVKPEIFITSPGSGATVSPPGMSVRVNAKSPAGVKKVDFFFDGTLVSTSTVAPFTGNIKLSSDLPDNSTHTIKAVIYDDLFRSSQSSVTVKIGDDETPPVVSFVYPKNNAKLTIGSGVSVKVDAHDPNGDVASVRYFVNGEVQATRTNAPFEWQFTPKTAGSYELSAVVLDKVGNKGETSIKVEAAAPSNNVQGVLRILEPANNSTFTEGSKIPIQGFISEGDRDNFKTLTFVAKKSGGGSQQIASISPGLDALSTYTTIWEPLAGTYELSLKITLNDGTLRFSNKVSVVIN